MPLTEKDREDLQALFDGELTAGEQSRVTAMAEESAEASAFLAELKALRVSLREAHHGHRRGVPSYKAVLAAAGNGTPSPESGAMRRIYAFSSGILALGLMVLLLLPSFMDPASPAEGFRTTEWSHTVERVETDLENVTPVVYLDEPSGWTVVWIVPDEESSSTARPAS